MAPFCQVEKTGTNWSRIYCLGLRRGDRGCPPAWGACLPWPNYPSDYPSVYPSSHSTTIYHTVTDPFFFPAITRSPAHARHFTCSELGDGRVRSSDKCPWTDKTCIAAFACR